MGHVVEVTRYEPTAEVVPSALPGAASAIVEWATAADAAYQLAQKLVVTAFVPDQFRGKPAEGAAAIIAGAEVGLSPIASLRSFDVIGGVAAPRALTLRAIAQAQGHQFVVDVATPTRVVIRGRRRGADEWQTVEWTIQRAQGLGLTGKRPWREQPQTMLIARATTEVVRLVAADAVLGIAYSAEELDDATEAKTTVSRTPARKTTVRRAALTPAEPEVPAPQGAPADVVQTVEAPAPEPGFDEPGPADGDEPAVTKAQLAKIAAGMRDLGITERPAALDYVSRAIGRRLGSRSELTRDEAHQVIETLEFDLRDEPDEPETEDEP